jgi:uncharacterized membrane protein
MPLPVVAVITGGLAAGATLAASDCKYSSLDALNYLLCALVVVISVGIMHLGRKGVLTVRTLVVAWGFMAVLFAVLGSRLQQAVQKGHQTKFVHAVSILSYVLSGLSVAIALLVYYAQVHSGGNPLDTLVSLQAKLEMMHRVK